MLRNFTSRLRRRWGNPLPSFSFSRDDAKNALHSEFGDSELAQIFFSGRGRRIHKWIHYLAIYERYLETLRHQDIKFLEIGVFGGGSLDMWREYLGARATIFGIDINPECAKLATPPTQIRIGSQADGDFLRSVVREMGGLDFVLDDGSHIGRHQRESFRALFPLLSDGGIYMIEDTHTSYWGQFGGGYRRTGTAIEFCKGIIDDMHAWYHGAKDQTGGREQIGAVHFHDSIIVIEKRKRARPGHVIIDAAEIAR